VPKSYNQTKPYVFRERSGDDQPVYKIVDAVTQKRHVAKGVNFAILLVAMAPLKNLFYYKKGDKGNQYPEKNCPAVSFFQSFRQKVQKSPAHQSA
jgi:hypothetical protein